MNSGGLVRYEGYAGTLKRGKGLKNKRTRKREIIRAEIRRKKCEAEKAKKQREYAEKESEKESSTNDYFVDVDYLCK